MRSHGIRMTTWESAMERLRYCFHSRIQQNGKRLPKFILRPAFFSLSLSLSIAEGDGIVVAFFVVTLWVGREIRRKSEHVTFRMEWSHFDDKLINNRYFLWIAWKLFLLFYSVRVRSSTTNTNVRYVFAAFTSRQRNFPCSICSVFGIWWNGKLNAVNGLAKKSI